jgi:hypothetical protein
MRRPVLPAVSAAGGGRVVALVASQHAFQARAQLAQVERFADIIVGTDLEADDAVDRLSGPGHHENADVVLLADEARETQTVLAGQADVENHDMRCLLPREWRGPGAR